MTEPKLMGNGEGNTLLILTDGESRLIREVLELEAELDDTEDRGRPTAAYAAFNRGVQRGTERIKAEFDAELKARKAKRT